MNKLKKNETKMIKKMMFKLRKSNAVSNVCKISKIFNFISYQIHIIPYQYFEKKCSQP